jgi:hypothetical protein
MRIIFSLVLAVTVAGCGTRAARVIAITDEGRTCVATCHGARHACYHSCSYGIAGLGCRRHCDDDDNRCAEGCPGV